MAVVAIIPKRSNVGNNFLNDGFCEDGGSIIHGSEDIKLLTSGTSEAVFEGARCAKVFFSLINANGPANKENVESHLLRHFPNHGM